MSLGDGSETEKTEMPASMAVTLEINRPPRIHVSYDDIEVFEKGNSVGLKDLGLSSTRFACRQVDSYYFLRDYVFKSLKQRCQMASNGSRRVEFIKPSAIRRMLELS
jgi:hypothetical protein